MAVIDFHSHVLPGMDDGSKSVEMSLAMLHAMKAGRTDLVVASSHYYGHKESIDAFLKRRAHAWDKLRVNLDTECPEIRLGAEVAFFSGLMKAGDLSPLCIEGTRTLLLEMPFHQWGAMEADALMRLCLDLNYQVVLAHLERFVDLQKDPGVLYDILNLPVRLQINAESVLPIFHRKRWLDLFCSGEAHLLGSDSHNMKERAPNLDQARRMIEKKCGGDVLQRIDRCGEELVFCGAEKIGVGNCE